MLLSADPIFYQELKRNDGAKRKLINIYDASGEGGTLKVASVEKPEWIDIEGLVEGTTITLTKGRPLQLIANINTTHKFFPRDECRDEVVSIAFEDETKLEISIIIQRIIDLVVDFKGVFAMDFGTSNTVYAHKTKLSDTASAAAAFGRAKCSDQIPSLVFFKDVSDHTHPKFLVGNEARYEIREYSSQTYSYFQSIKRDVGTGRPKYLVLDEFAGARRDHRQEWSAEEIASFLIRAVLERAQSEIGERVTQVVATFPTLYTEDKKDALENAFRKAFEDQGIEWTDRSLMMRLDEANAATFNYIYGAMLDEFRKFDTTHKEAYLLAYDFGGGSTDVSLIHVEISRDDAGRVVIKTALKGITGDLYFGGDNMTLHVYRLLKNRAALAVAGALYEPVEEKAEEEEEKPAEEDLWAAVAAQAKAKAAKEEEEDLWAAPAEEEEKKEEKEEEVEEDPELRDIVNHEDPDTYKAAAAAVAKARAVLELAMKKAQDTLTSVIEIEKKEGAHIGKDQSKIRAEEIEDAVEMLIPTRWAKYEDLQPLKVELARRLFHELWHEADVLKVRCSTADSGRAKVSGVLKRVAKYAGVDPIIFNNIELDMPNINTHIEPGITANIKRAHALYKGAVLDEAGGLLLTGGGTEEKPEVRILLFGNSSHLPIVRKKMAEVFGVSEDEIVMDREHLKTAVAQGACEEQFLAREFGSEGLIQYNSEDFLKQIPYSMGLFNPDLKLIGYEDGFCPIFSRGTDVGAARILDSKNFFLIHPDMEQLAVYANYLDGVPPQYIGWFDFRNPVGNVDLAAESVSASDTIVPGAKKQESGGDLIGEGAGDAGGGLIGEGPAPAEASAEKAAAPEGGEESFKVKIVLLPDRTYQAINLRTGTLHGFVPRKEVWKPEQNPFAGVH